MSGLFFVSELHHGNTYYEEQAKQYAVKNEEIAIKKIRGIIRTYFQETIWLLENYQSFCLEMQKERKEGTESNKQIYYDEISKFCDFRLLEDLMEEIMEKNISNDEKFQEAILTITENCFCSITYEKITDDDLAREIIDKGMLHVE